MTLDDRGQIGFPSEGPVGQATPLEARSEEGVGNGSRCVADEERGLEGKGEALDDRARLALLDGRKRLLCERRDGRLAREADLREQRLRRFGLAAKRPERVEANDVARSLPDREQRLLAIEPRHARLLDEPVPAETLERLGRVPRPALADPVLRDGGRE